MDEFKISDYNSFLTKLAQIMKNLNEIKIKTNATLNTINTNYDFTETLAMPSNPFLGVAANLAMPANPFLGNAVVNIPKQNKNNKKIKNAVSEARKKLVPVAHWTESDIAQKLISEINSLLDGQNVNISEINRILESLGAETAAISSSGYSFEDIQKNTRDEKIDVHEHGSYSKMTFDQIIFGDAAEDQTTLGTVTSTVLQFVPLVGEICDVRDVIADGYLWIEKSGDYSASEKTELGIFTGLDIIGFIPIIGVVKYVDEVADIVKAGSKVSDTRKAIEAMDNIKNVKNIEKGSEVIKDSARSTDAVKAAKSKTDDIIRKVQSNEIELKTKKQKGNFAEMRADQYLEDEIGYKRMGSVDSRIQSLDDKIHHGIDGIYENASPPPKYVIAEVKYNHSQLNKHTGDGPQMGKQWVDKRIDKAVSPEEAQKIKMEMANHPENVQKLLVRVMPDGSVTTKILE